MGEGSPSQSWEMGRNRVGCVQQLLEAFPPPLPKAAAPLPGPAPALWPCLWQAPSGTAASASGT